jgi:hypothetical protein
VIFLLNFIELVGSVIELAVAAVLSPPLRWKLEGGRDEMKARDASGLKVLCLVLVISDNA